MIRTALLWLVLALPAAAQDLPAPQYTSVSDFAHVLTSDVVVSAFHSPVLAEVLVYAYLCIEIGRSVWLGVGMATGAPDEVGGETPSISQ